MMMTAGSASPFLSSTKENKFFIYLRTLYKLLINTNYDLFWYIKCFPTELLTLAAPEIAVLVIALDDVTAVPV